MVELVLNVRDDRFLYISDDMSKTRRIAFLRAFNGCSVNL